MEGKSASGRASQGPRENTPEITDILSPKKFVTVVSRVGSDVDGFVCDRDEAGILLDVRDPSGDPEGYQFLPWSSIERVSIKG